MSELKAYTYDDMIDGDADTNIEYYPKSEADKVIAELKRKNNEVETELELWRDGSIISEEHQKELDGKRHSDYKRCLAMAKWCRMHDEFTQLESERLGLQQRTLFFEYRKKAMWWNKWCKRWLELAENFKEWKCLEKAEEYK